MKSNDLTYGRRAVVEKQKMLFRHLEDIIRFNTNKNRKYTPEIIRELVMDVAAGKMSYRAAAAKHGISYNTVNEWKRKGWIYEAVDIGRELSQDTLDRRFTGIINKALDNIDVALEKGDGYVGKDGKVKRKPVTAKDNALVAAIAFDKRQLVRGEATNITDNTDSNKKLEDLKAQFEQFATREEKTIEGKAERVEENEQGLEGNTEEPDSNTAVQEQLGLGIQEKQAAGKE